MGLVRHPEDEGGRRFRRRRRVLSTSDCSRIEDGAGDRAHRVDGMVARVHDPKKW